MSGPLEALADRFARLAAEADARSRSYRTRAEDVAAHRAEARAYSNAARQVDDLIRGLVEGGAA